MLYVILDIVIYVKKLKVRLEFLRVTKISGISLCLDSEVVKVIFK